MKRVLLLLMAFVLLFSISLPALADSESLPPLTDLSPNPDYYYGSWSLGISPMSTAIAITNADYSIVKVSATSVKTSASTTANQTADMVGGTMYLQKWENNAWATIKTSSFSDDHVVSHSGSATFTVTSGYYYRLKTTHSAKLDNITVTRTTYTGGIFIN